MPSDTPKPAPDQSAGAYMIGQAFVTADADRGEMSGPGDYCGFPIDVRIDRDTRNGVSGWRVRIFVRGKA